MIQHTMEAFDRLDNPHASYGEVVEAYQYLLDWGSIQYATPEQQQIARELEKEGVIKSQGIIKA